MIAHIPFDEKKYKEAIGVKELFGEKDIAHWNVTVAVRLLTYVAFGADIQEKVLKPYCLQRLMLKYLAG